ncbi:DNA-binding transcriptional MerR regulator [Staphylococcus auricularis]|uniref:MerR family transcriptional regulator n=1 Tax=Staphylococcus auricularis TaxID=29379 RepID=UPI001933216C|nr:MerR family transcriptional regulator [Staphylococcus auricularis]MCG7341551.1 MerR family transcriptional regulator [Staphylococcus auricularis]
MSTYTTGELAKLCGVSVRTVQYYDQKGLIHSTQKGESKHRSFNDTARKQLEQILVLKSLSFSLKDIQVILTEEDDTDILKSTLKRQRQEIESTVSEQQNKLARIKWMEGTISNEPQYALKALPQLHHFSQTRGKLKHVYQKVGYILIVIGLVECAGLIASLFFKKWWVMVLVILALIPVAYLLTRYIYKRIAYICPKTNQVFKPSFWAYTIASHTPRTRKLKSPFTHEKTYCLEVYDDTTEDNKH